MYHWTIFDPTRRTLQAVAACCLLFASASSFANTGQYHANVRPGEKTRMLDQATGCGMPRWPRTSIRFDEAPQIELGLLLDRRGRVIATRVGKSTGVKLFDNAARKAVKTCQFPRASGTTHAPAHWSHVIYQWHLD